MNGKSLYLIALLVAVVGLATSRNFPAISENLTLKANASHNLVVGSRVFGDRLVLTQSIIKTSSWLQIVKVEQTFNITRYEKITQVKALDQKTNGNGATPSLLGGGPGTNYVTLQFKSKRSHGINFVVEIYAKPY